MKHFPEVSDPKRHDWERDFLSMYVDLSRTGDDVAPYEVEGQKAFLVNTPELAREVLETREEAFGNPPFPYELITRIVSDTGAFLLRRDKARGTPVRAQTHWHEVGEAIRQVALDFMNQISARPNPDAPYDCLIPCKTMLLRLTTRSLFGVDPDDLGDAAATAADQVEPFHAYRNNFGMDIPVTPEEQDQYMNSLLLNSTYSGEILIRTHPEFAGCNPSDPIQPPPPPDVDDNRHPFDIARSAVTRTLMNGYNGTAVALCWLLHLMAAEPEIQQRIADEIQEKQGNKAWDIKARSSLRYTRTAVQESLRLYPTAWIFGRLSLTEQKLGDVTIPQFGFVSICPYTIQRDPRYWNEPDRFLPERFSPENSKKHVPFSYIPFGGGTRQCPAHAFAVKELQFLLAMILQRFKLELPTDHVVRPWGLVSLRPSPALKVIFRER